MGVTDGEAFSNAVGYNVTSTSTPGTTVPVTDTSENTVASGIKRMSGIHIAILVFSKGYRPKQGKVVP